MDEQSPQKNDRLSVFFHHPVRTNAFGSNRSGDRLYQRAERITAALYLLTNHIDPDEPVRAEVRRCALELLSCVFSGRDEMRSENSPKVIEVRMLIRQLISQVRILAISGFVSIQNAEIIIATLDETGILLGTMQRSPLSDSIVINREDLMGAYDVPERSSRPRIKDIKDSSFNKDRSMSDTDGALSDRMRNILGILKIGGHLGIRDIALQVPEYSEKMIQRDLSVLISSGAVIRTGLKRWSRYSLAQAHNIV